ncbi:MAG: hypothetical protein ABSA41_01720 [Terriglobia bacterium]
MANRKVDPAMIERLTLVLAELVNDALQDLPEETRKNASATILAGFPLRLVAEFPGPITVDLLKPGTQEVVYHFVKGMTGEISKGLVN